MANYIVSYDLNGPNPTHQQMDEHIEASGWSRGRVLETVWYIGTDQGIGDVYAYIRQRISQNDRLIVLEAIDANFRNLLVNDESLQQAWQDNR